MSGGPEEALERGERQHRSGDGEEDERKAADRVLGQEEAVARGLQQRVGGDQQEEERGKGKGSREGGLPRI
jgi:hypothetical protein